MGMYQLGDGWWDRMMKGTMPPLVGMNGGLVWWSVHTSWLMVGGKGG